jgi:hypothetical protein
MGLEYANVVDGSCQIDIWLLLQSALIFCLIVLTISIIIKLIKKNE